MFNIIICCIGLLVIFPKEYLAFCISDRCYQVYDVSVKQSKADCDTGSHLVEIHNAQIQNDLESFLTDGEYWIGLDDNDSEGTYKWHSGSSLTYKNFAPYDKNTNGHDYVYISASDDWQWFTANGNHRKGYICTYIGTPDPETTFKTTTIQTTTTQVTTTTLETTTTPVTTTTTTPVTTTTLETTTTPVTTTTLETTTTPVTTTTLETTTSVWKRVTQIIKIWCPDLHRTFSYNNSETVTHSAQLQSLLDELDDQGDAIQENKKKRRNTSASDDRVSSQTIGLIGVAMLSCIGLVILILDLSSIKRDLATLRGNLCPPDSHIIEV